MSDDEENIDAKKRAYEKENDDEGTSKKR